jgi:hypothetical protein
MSIYEEDCIKNGLRVQDARVMAYREYLDSYGYKNTKEKQSASQKISWMWQCGECYSPILWGDFRIEI